MKTEKEKVRNKNSNNNKYTFLENNNFLQRDKMENNNFKSKLVEYVHDNKSV